MTIDNGNWRDKYPDNLPAWVTEEIVDAIETLQLYGVCTGAEYSHLSDLLEG